MKKIISFVFFISLFGSSFCFSQSPFQNSIIRKASDKETIYVTVESDKVKDTIASLELDGWVFEGMARNRDKTWTIIMVRWNNNKIDGYGEDNILGDKIPDGVYYTDHYPYSGHMIRMEQTFKDGKLIGTKMFMDNNEKE